MALQYGNAFGQGMQAAALKPADFFGNDDVLYLMEDMATGEIRLSILWEWLHKRAGLTADDASGGQGRRTHSSPNVVHAARRGVQQAPSRQQSRRDDDVEGHDASHRAEIVAAYLLDDSSFRGTSTCST